MKALVVQANALRLPLADATVDLIVTSPPYFALRSYRDGDEHYAGQIGSEATPGEFLEALWTATREMIRVLKPSGSIFVNLGDKYAGSGGGNQSGILAHRNPAITAVHDAKVNAFDGPRRYNQNSGGIPAKSLMGLPWRYANGCVDQLGLVLRAEIVWNKPNGLPESVTDRVRRSHETWFHFTRQGRYFSAVDEVREAHADPDWQKRQVKWVPKEANDLDTYGKRSTGEYLGDHASLGKLPGSVWRIEEEDVDWIGRIGLCRRCRRLRVAGGGSVASILRATATTGSPTSGTDGLIASSTSYGSGRSQMDSPSTTSAVTGPASDPIILSPSRSESTSDAETPLPLATPPSELATTATSSRRRTPTSGLVGVESVDCVCETVSESDAPGSVWRVPSEPLLIPEAALARLDLPDHFAAFPQEWPRRLILGWSPSGICVECGEGRRPVVAKRLELDHASPGRTAGWKDASEPDGNQRGMNGDGMIYRTEATITGYACACDAPIAPTRPAVVLDPFGGTGTTAMVARALGRIGISVDLSHAYGRLARWRIFESDAWHKAEARTWAERQGVML